MSCTALLLQALHPCNRSQIARSLFRDQLPGSLHEWWAPQDQVDLLLRPSVRGGSISLRSLPLIQRVRRRRPHYSLSRVTPPSPRSHPTEKEKEREDGKILSLLSFTLPLPRLSSLCPPFPSFCSLSFRVPFFPLRPPPTPTDPYFDPQSASPSQSLTTFWRRRADGHERGRGIGKNKTEKEEGLRQSGKKVAQQRPAGPIF